MPRQVGKNQKVTRIEFSDFSGGMNTEKAAYRLDQNQCVEATNFEFSDKANKFQTRRGIGEPIYSFQANIKKIWYDNTSNKVYVFVENENDSTKPLDMYEYSPETGVRTAKMTYVGTLLGNNPDILPECCNFQGNVFVASGSYLQVYLLNPPEWLLGYKNQFLSLNNQPTSSSIRRYSITINQTSSNQTIHVYQWKKGGQRIDHTTSFIADFGDFIDVEVVPKTGYVTGTLVDNMGESINDVDSMDTFRLNNSYLAKGVFQYYGRLVTYHNENILRFSKIGDPFIWFSDIDVANNANLGKDVEIGYKDEGYIVGAYPFNGGIVIFKSSGTIYFFSGDPTNGTVQQIGIRSDIVNKDAVCKLGGELTYMSYHGMRNLTTSGDNGNFQNDNVSRQIDNLWIKDISWPIMWNESRKHCLLISVDRSNVLWCYQYMNDCYTRWEFPENVRITALAESNQDLFIGNGKYFCKFIEDGQDYDASTKKLVKINQIFKSREITDSDLLNAFKEHIKVTPLYGNEEVNGSLYIYDEPKIQDGDKPYLARDFKCNTFYPNFHMRHQVRSEALQWEVHFYDPMIWDMFRADVIVSQDGGQDRGGGQWTKLSQQVSGS